MTLPKITNQKCTRCKVQLASETLGSHLPIVYMGDEIDPLKTMPLCHQCAIVACFRCGRPGKT